MRPHSPLHRTILAPLPVKPPRARDLSAGRHPLRFLLAFPLLLAVCGALAGLAVPPVVPEDLTVTADSFFRNYVFVWLAEVLETAIWVFFNLATPAS